MAYKIDLDTCIGCGSCVDECPVNAISGTVKNPHVINAEECIRCGQCKTVCRFGAVKVE